MMLDSQHNAIFGGAFIIGAVIFFVGLAFGIRDIITRRDEDRYLISNDQKDKEHS